MSNPEQLRKIAVKFLLRSVVSSGGLLFTPQAVYSSACLSEATNLSDEFRVMHMLPCW